MLTSFQFVPDGKMMEPGRIHIGTFVRIADGRPVVDFGGPAGEIAVESLIALDGDDSGSRVAVAFHSDAAALPLLLGRIAAAPTLTVDGAPAPLEITADREITLRCGKASITLTRAGKIILRGTYISSRSSGVNRIKGGSVQLN